MKRFTTLFLFLFLPLSQIGAIVVCGNLTYGKEIIDSLDANGMITLDGTTISDLLKVNGALQANNCNIGKLDIKGSTILDNCCLKQFSTIEGLLTARGSYFPQGLSVTSHSIELSACTLPFLQVPEEKESNEPQIVTLKNGTKIEKRITFQSGEGQVHMDSTCQVGSVKGGKIYQTAE